MKSSNPLQPLGEHEPTAVVSDPLIGELVAEYRVVERIGSGSAGVVYEAWTSTGDQVAIKVLKAELAKDAKYVEQMLNEARAVALLRHPGVVLIHNVGALPSGRPYVVMERLDGETLETWAKGRGPLSIPLVKALAIQLCKVLGAVHAEGIVHRDLKPGNVFVIKSPAGPLLKLLDFGIATTTKGLTLETHNAEFIGTPSVMAPEQIRGERISPKTDLYALGAVIFRLLTGSDPFEATNAAEVLMQQLGEPAPDPRVKRPDTPEALAKLVLSLLEKNPKDRPPAAEVVERALSPVASARPSRPPVALGAAEPALTRIDRPIRDDESLETTVEIPFPQERSAAPEPAPENDPTRAKARTLGDLIAQPPPKVAAFEQSRTPEMKEGKPKPKQKQLDRHHHRELPGRRWPLVVGVAVGVGAVATFALVRHFNAAPPTPPVELEKPAPKAVVDAPVAKARPKPHGPLTAKGLLSRADLLGETLQKVAPKTTYSARVELRRLRRRAEVKTDAAELEAISNELDTWEGFYLPK